MLPPLTRLAPVALVLGGACAFGEPVATDASDGVDSGLPVDAAAPDAPPDAAPDAGCTDQFINLLANPDFEGGNVDWTEATNGAQMIIREVGNGLPFDPEAGTWGALLLGFNNASVALTQQVAVPADATALRLRGFRCWVTDEGAGEFDLMSIDLRDDAGDPLESLMSLTNEDAAATCAWEPFEITAADVYAGQTIELALAGTSDAATITSFAFDTFALEAQVCQ